MYLKTLNGGMCMKKNEMIRFVVRMALGLAGAAMVAVSCSVKEDREPCPSYLEITFPERNVVSNGVGIGAWNTRFLFFDNIDLGDYPESYLCAVERQELVLCAYTGKNRALREERKMMIPFGSQCDSLYAFYKEIDCRGEIESCEVRFHKQFATVSVDIRKSVSEMKAYTAVIDGNTCGFDVLSFVPVLGPFEYKASAIQNDYLFRFRIPRQLDNSMSLTLYKDNNVVGQYPLGRLIERMGYDWLEDDLRDIIVSIDHVAARLSILIEGWEIAEDFELSEVVL